jgi:hypothetical protein
LLDLNKLFYLGRLPYDSGALKEYKKDYGNDNHMIAFNFIKDVEEFYIHILGLRALEKPFLIDQLSHLRSSEPLKSMIEYYNSYYPSYVKGE